MKKTIFKTGGTALLLPALALISLLFTGVAQAATSLYDLSNHPGSGDGVGGGTSQQFGLRLDGLLLGDPDEIYLFDFDDASSTMRLIWDDIANTITIFGQAYGGQDDGLGGFVAGTEAVWDINFTYGMVVPGDIGPVGGSFDDLLVGDTGPNNGTVSSVLGSFTLEDHYSPLFGAAFIFGDNPLVSQGFDVLSGWGWLDYCDEDNVCRESSIAFTNDWLFEATVVPVPAAAWLFGSCLIGLITLAKRRKT